MKIIIGIDVGGSTTKICGFRGTELLEPLFVKAADPVASVYEMCIRDRSINLLLEDPGDPVVWRGPVIAGTVKQFWTDVIWSDVDFMFVDMPPGTGDVPLTVFQSLPVDGIDVYKRQR